jgi:hypothetical protein
MNKGRERQREEIDTERGERERREVKERKKIITGNEKMIQV